MAITTLDGAIAGFQPPVPFVKVTGTMEAAGVMHSLFYTAGLPGAAATPAPGLAGAALTTYAGQLNYSNPASGLKYLAGIEASAGVAGTLYLCDRLWHNSGLVVTTTTAQAVGSAAFPARDSDGAISGRGVMIGMEVSTATTNAGAITNTTMIYDNSDGTPTKTATMPSFPATAAVGTFVPFLLAAGDKGVKAITSVTLGTSRVAGALHLVAYRVLASVGIGLPNAGVQRDVVQVGMPHLHDNTVPFLIWLPTATTTTTVTGQVLYTEG